MFVHFIIVAVLAVIQGGTTPPSINEDSLPGHTNHSLLYNLLEVAGFSETCVSGVLDYCSSAQEEAHYPSIIQEIQGVKVEVQEIKEMVEQIMLELVKNESRPRHCKDLLDSGDSESVQEVKETVTQVVPVRVLLKNELWPSHCKDLLDSGDSGSGLRQVYPYSGRPDDRVTVYCEQDIDGGGWTVFQRRVNNTVREDFYRNWTEYQAGFGDLEGEFWLGLDLLHELTITDQELRVDLHDYEGEHRWAKYGTFRVGSEDTNYRLTIGRYSGDAGDAMTWHNGQEFSTHDADHDNNSNDCAKERHGAWWYRICAYSNLNGYQYEGAPNSSTYAKGIFWQQWRDWDYSLMRTAMMVRPVL